MELWKWTRESQFCSFHVFLKNMPSGWESGFCFLLKNNHKCSFFFYIDFNFANKYSFCYLWLFRNFTLKGPFGSFPFMEK